MWTRHVTTSLPSYCDGELPAAAAARVAAHLESCVDCQATLADIRVSAQLLRTLPRVTAPVSVWNRVDAALQPAQRLRFGLGFRWAIACLLLIAAIGGFSWFARESALLPWEVARAGEAVTRRMATGDWVQTDAASTARIMVGSLGTVDVAPGSRVQLGEVRDSEYRIALAHGTISAVINAPPRLFFVDTAASTVVDLGCAYTVTVGDDGAGELRMTSGWAALEFKGRTSMVPAGAVCRTRPGRGPGTPYFADASPQMKQAVDAFDSGSDTAAGLEVILREARARDTLTLWHLLSRVEPADRQRVFDRIVVFQPPPPDVSVAQILALDPDALRRWREELAWTW